MNKYGVERGWREGLSIVTFIFTQPPTDLELVKAAEKELGKDNNYTIHGWFGRTVILKASLNDI